VRNLEAGNRAGFFNLRLSTLYVQGGPKK